MGYVAAAFATGLATMVVEIAAGRVLAPVMGVSLYSWTAVIGLVLGGLAVGAWLGGWLADRWSPSAALAAGALLGGFGALALPSVADIAPNVLLVPRTEVIGRTLWLTGATLALPSLGLGAIVPAAVRGFIATTTSAGSAVGAVYAASTAGSILGVFLAGFVLVDLVGSRGSVALAGAAMLAVALLSLPRRPLWLAGTAAAAVALVASSRTSLAGPCTWESAYFCLQIVDEQLVGNRVARSLRLDRLTHGSVYLDDQTYLDYGYVRVMADLTRALPADLRGLRTLSIGGGSYTLPRFLEARYVDASVEVVEIDPKVTGAATAFLGLRPNSRVVSHNVDARQFFLDRTRLGEYHVIYGDAFNDLSIPHHLTTREFALMVRNALRDDGFYLANVIDLFHSGRFLRSYIATLESVFPYVHVVVDLGTFGAINANAALQDPRRTYVVVAAPQFLDFSRLEGVSNQSAIKLDDTFVRHYVDDPSTVILTDDYAPVDKLVSPIFLARPF